MSDAIVIPAMRGAKTYGQLQLRGDHWVMSGVPPHVALRLKSMFPRIAKHETKTFRFLNTPESCADLQWFLSRYPMEVARNQATLLKKGSGDFEKRREEIEAILLPEWQPPERIGFKPGFGLYQGQAQAVEILHRLGRLLVLDDVGLGKTWIAMGALVGSPYLPAAIVVPAHLPSQWVEKFIKPHTYLNAHIIEGTQPYRLPPANVYIFRYSNLAGWSDIAAENVFRSVFFDEIHHLRNGTDTAKGKAAKVFCEHTHLRCGFSATPVFNYGSEIFKIVDMIEPGALGDWYEFVREWCRMGPGQKWIVKDPVALGSYLRELQLVVRRVRQGRPINRLVIEVEYDEEVERDSLELARELALKVVTGTFTERGQAARELDNFSRMITGVAKAKSVAAYVRMLLKNGEPVILTGWHRDVYRVWMDELSEFNPMLYTGSETPKEKDRCKQAFITGETNLMILSLRSGEGLDGLQERCSTIVFGELDWSPQIDEQVLGRVDRPGQKKNEITAIYLYANAGSDPTVMGVRGLKKSQARGIVDITDEVEEVYSDQSRIQALAAHYLDRSA